MEVELVVEGEMQGQVITLITRKSKEGQMGWKERWDGRRDGMEGQLGCKGR
jgi:hypothetical protein